MEITPEAIISGEGKKVYCCECRHFWQSSYRSMLFMPTFEMFAAALKNKDKCGHPRNKIRKKDWEREWG